MEPLRRAGPLLVCLAFISYVQCQWNQIENPKGLRTFNQGRRSHKDDWSTKFRPTVPISRVRPHIGSHSEHESTRHRRRVRRQSRNDNAVRWNHQFTIQQNQPTSLTAESTQKWEEYIKRLKHILEKEIEFQFLNPSGLRILIPGNNVNMEIMDYRVKLNEEFRGNDNGHFALNRYKTNNMWVYEIHNLKLVQGDRLHYWLRLTVGKEAFDVVVKGVLDIANGNPHITSSYMANAPYRPAAPVLTPQSQFYNGGPSPTLGGTREAFRWMHQFTINSTSTNAFTKESASSWTQNAEILKRFLQNQKNFKFSNPVGLTILIPDYSITIVDLRIKLNDAFRDNDGGYFTPIVYKSDNMLNYDFPQLRVQQGDTVYYWMRVRHKDGFDAIARGQLEIIQGNPHTGPSFINNLPIGGGQPSIGGGQPSIGGGQPASGSGQTPAVDRFGQPGDSGGQTFKWNHKFTSVNLNVTPEVGIAYDPETLPDKVDEYFKKMLDRDIDFEYLNPTGLRILLSGGDNLRILAFHIKLNEEFKGFEAGHYNALAEERSDGRWSYSYPNLKLRQGDKAYYWMRVTFGKEMWLYVVKGFLDIISGDPHNVLNSVGKTIPPPRPAYNSIRTTTTSPRPTNEVDNKPAMGGGGGSQPEWDHKYSINKTKNDGSAPEEEQLVKNIIENNMEFKFLNPSGLSILFSGEDKDFRVLAFNIKLNEQFKTLGPGDYVANVTRRRDGRLNYYYPNLKVKPGDKLYYWARVALVKDTTDYIVAAELKLKQGDPHIGGPVPDVPAPVIWAQPLPRPAEASDALSNNQPPNQAYATSSPVLENKNQAPIQDPLTQTPIPSNENQPPNKVPSTQIPVPKNVNEPLKQVSSTGAPLPNNVNLSSPRPAEPLPLSINQFSTSPAPVSGTPTRLCSASEPGPNEGGSCQDVVVTYNKKMDGTVQIIIDAKTPFWCTLEPRQHRSPPHARRVFLKPDPPENPYEKLKPRDLQPPPLPRKNSVYIELEHLSKDWGIARAAGVHLEPRLIFLSLRLSSSQHIKITNK